MIDSIKVSDCGITVSACPHGHYDVSTTSRSVVGPNKVSQVVPRSFDFKSPKRSIENERLYCTESS